MKEIKLKDSNLDLTILINDYPDLQQMPKEDLKLLATRLELEISNCVERELEVAEKDMVDLP